MTSRKTNNHGHFLLSPGFLGKDCRTCGPSGGLNFRPSQNIHCLVALAPRCPNAGPARHGVPQIERFEFQISLLCVLRMGVASWGQYQRFRVRSKSKPNERLSKPTNKRSWPSDRCFLQSPERFGRSRQRRILRHAPIVRCVPLNSTSAVNAIGPATQSPPSFQKFSDVTPCAT